MQENFLFDPGYVSPRDFNESRTQCESAESQPQENAKLIALCPEMLQVVQRLAAVGFMGETELAALVNKCRRIIEALEE